MSSSSSSSGSSPCARPISLAPAETARAAPERPETREEAVESAQQRIGNRAVSRLLARDENPKLKQAPQPPLKPVGEVDAIFDTSVHVKDMIGAKLGKGAIAKAMISTRPRTSRRRGWSTRCARSIPTPRQGFASEDEARAFLKKKGVRAFQDSARGKIHLNKERANLGTQLHESLHFFSSERWKDKMGYVVNEGVTEFFTRAMGPEVGVERDINSFLQEFTSATHLVEAAGEQAVASAYFDGDISGLERTIDGRKPEGAGTWRKWLRHLDDRDFKAANALLKL